MMVVAAAVTPCRRHCIRRECSRLEARAMYYNKLHDNMIGLLLMLALAVVCVRGMGPHHVCGARLPRLCARAGVQGWKPLGHVW